MCLGKMPSRFEIIRAKRRAIGGKRPRCKKGISCSAACINRNKWCLVDTPTPVARSLSKAVKSIQGRKERLRKFVKKKVKGDIKLESKRKEYTKKRNSLRVQVQRAIFSGDASLEKKLRVKLERLEEAGLKIGMPRSKPIDPEEVKERFLKSRLVFIRRLSSVYDEMYKAAWGSSRDGSKPLNRPLYDKTEKKFLDLVDKSKKTFLRWVPGAPMADLAHKMSVYKKGMFWGSAEISLKPQRSTNLNNVYTRLVADAEKAAKDGDLAKYRQVERKLLRLGSKVGHKLINVPKKGSIWLKARMPELWNNLQSAMKDALESGDLNKFNRLEGKLIKITDRYQYLGGRAYFYSKGQMLNSHTDELRKGMSNAITLKDRKEYNKLEGKLLKLDPSEKKGRMWKERLVEPFRNSLDNKIWEAAKRGDRKEYNKLERIMMRINPNYPKGRDWIRFSEERVRAVIANLESEMRAAIKANDRGSYDRLEARLFRTIRKSNPSSKSVLWSPLASIDRDTTPGKMWKEFSGVKSLSPLNTEDQFKAKERKTSFMHRALKSAAVEVSRLLGHFENESWQSKIIPPSEVKKLNEARGKAGFNIADAILALRAYTYSQWTRKIRLAQRKESAKGEAARYARNLESFLRWGELPRPQVEKFRGFRTTPSRLKEMIESAEKKEKFNHDTTYSWSSSLGVGRKFADKPQGGKSRSERVIFRTVNKFGVPIEFSSQIPDEYEILTHKGVSYRYSAYKTIKVDGVTYHVFDVKELGTT